MLKKLNKYGYITNNEKLAKIMQVFKMSGERNKKNISAMLLEGAAGAGKTFLAETFASIVGAKLKFLQCYPGMGSEALLTEPNIPAILRSDSQNAIKEGILVKSLLNTVDGPTVLVLDELDKSSSELDSFLLDFLNSGRITNGTEEWQKSNSPLWVFFTSNGERELSDALLNRCRKITIERPSKEIFLKSLGLNEENSKGIGVIYDQFKDFTLRQAKEYLADLNELETDFDIDILSQYVDIENIEITSLEGLEMFGVQEQEDISYPTIEMNRFKLSDENSFNIIKKLVTQNMVNFTKSKYGEAEIEFKDLATLNYIMETFKVKTRVLSSGYISIPQELINDSIMCSNTNVSKRYGVFLINNPQGGEIKVEGFSYNKEFFMYLSSELINIFWENNIEEDDEYDEYDED